MKIFSLRTKTSLVSWSILVGIVFNFAVNKFTLLHEICSPGFSGIYIPCGGVNYGFPFLIFEGYMSIPEAGLLEKLAPLLNYAFWILITLVILGSVRYFLRKNQLLSPKQN